MSGSQPIPVRTIHVLIVDDSRTFRACVEQALANAQDIVVVGSVGSGAAALEFIKSHHVDIVTLDVEMPDCDGFETLVALSKFQRPATPGVIMLSAFTQKGAEATIRALEAGAGDFIAKPAGPDSSQNIELLRRQLLVKIRCLTSKKSLSGKDVTPPPTPTPSPSPNATPPQRRIATVRSGRYRLVVIGVSTGGPKALSILLPELMETTALPILVTQHMPPGFTKSLSESLSRRCPWPVLEAEDGQPVEECHAYIAPGGRHMLLNKSRDGGMRIAINDQPPENGCRPSVDVLFRSAAALYGGAVVAIVLTGMGTDGTKGLGPLKRAGAYAIAQDEESSIVWGMPGSAVAADLVDEVCPIDRIASAIGRLHPPVNVPPTLALQIASPITTVR